MDFFELKEQMKKIEMSDEAKNRVINNCRYKLAMETEENKVKKFSIKRPVVAVAAVVLCLCLAVCVGAAATGGMFADIKDWRGAVTGTEYVQASDEINAVAEAKEDMLTVKIEALEPNKAPYGFFDQLGIGSYRILDKFGAAVAEGENTEAVAFAEGKAQIVLSFDGTEGECYVLEISSFIASSKADQPMKISGSWECEFVV